MSQGQHVDNTKNGSFTQFLKSVLDHRSLYVQISNLNKQVEAVCDNATSVSCVSEKHLNQNNKNHHVKIQPSTTRPNPSNQIPP